MYLKKFSAVLFLTFIFTLPAYAEYVFLKDGSIVEGSIVSDSAASVTVYTREKKSRVISRGNIMRILYTELYMGKVYVQKIDGKNEICYMVDEDRDTYTFRKELYSPEEFKLRRDQVLFMARGNPTGLEGETDTDRVHLKWFKPYNPVKKYKIYIKTPGDAKFRAADESGSVTHTLKGLKSNTKYFLIVTAIDNDGDESAPSNELAVTTKNIKPDAPSNFRIKNVYSSDGKTFTAEMKWDEAEDPDGKVTGYNIYRHDSGEGRPAGNSRKNEFSVKGLSSEKYYQFSVKSVDDKKEESETGVFETTTRPFLSVEPEIDYVLPMGKLGDMLGAGYGGQLSVYYTDLMFKNLDAGVTSGFWYFGGKGDTVDSSFMVPVTASFRYRYYFTPDFSIAASLHGGAFYNSIVYMKLNGATLQTEEVTESAFEPAVRGGISVEYRFGLHVRGFVSAGYGTIFEPDERISFATLGAGVSVLFY